MSITLTRRVKNGRLQFSKCSGYAKWTEYSKRRARMYVASSIMEHLVSRVKIHIVFWLSTICRHFENLDTRHLKSVSMLLHYTLCPNRSNIKENDNKGKRKLGQDARDSDAPKTKKIFEQDTDVDGSKISESKKVKLSERSDKE